MTTENLQPTKAEETKRIKRLIRAGQIPRRAFVKDKRGRLERKPDKYGHMRLTWRTEDTLSKLTADLK